MNKIVKIFFKDFVSASKMPNIWMNLALVQIKSSYKRTKLGPFWITLSTGILLFGIGPLYSLIFKTPLGDYFLFLVIGFVSWMFIRSSIADSVKIFTENGGIILSQPFPLNIYLLKNSAKNIIAYFHNSLVIVAVMIFFPPSSFPNLILYILGLFLCVFTLYNISILCSVICCRFRDLENIIDSILTVSFFLTPILWKPGMIEGKAYILYLNPFYLLVDIIRAPILESSIDTKVLLGLLILNLILLPLSVILFGKFKKRIAFWL